jgi:hypothetical protein
MQLKAIHLELLNNYKQLEGTHNSLKQERVSHCRRLTSATHPLAKLCPGASSDEHFLGQQSLWEREDWLYALRQQKQHICMFVVSRVPLLCCHYCPHR